LRGKGYDYWALGHVHRREVVQDDPPIVFPGNTQGRHARETGPKGCMLVTVEDSGLIDLQFQSTDVVRWVTADVDAQGSRSGYDIVDDFSRCLTDLLKENEDLPLAVRVRLEGETEACDDILAEPERWTNEIRAAALEIGGGIVWVEKVILQPTTPSSATRLKRGEGAIDELLKVFEELSADRSSRLQLAEELTTLGKKLPRDLTEDSDGLRLDDADWLKEMLEQARPMLIRHLLRREGTE
jgi:DNA repair exonuclease SbcCD nuclease subunit